MIHRPGGDESRSRGVDRLIRCPGQCDRSDFEAGTGFLEATKMPGKGRLTLTGSLGDVMMESVRAVLSLVRANAEALSIAPEDFDRFDLHVHVPAGATTKDGPSAGDGLATAIASIFTGRAVGSTVAIIGETALPGKVLPVGGVE